MLDCTLTASGKTTDDLVMGLEEAIERIKAGNLMGFDSNDDGRFHFDITGEEEMGELACRECGNTMIVGPHALESSDGVSHHLTDEGGIDFDQDEDHVAVAN